MVNKPKIELRAGAAAGIDRQVVLLAELFEETKCVALTAVGSLKLLQQKHHRVMDQTHHIGPGDPLKGQRS